jgi:hypothetical protein
MDTLKFLTEGISFFRAQNKHSRGQPICRGAVFGYNCDALTALRRKAILRIKNVVIPFTFVDEEFFIIS